MGPSESYGLTLDICNSNLTIGQRQTKITANISVLIYVAYKVWRIQAFSLS